MATEDFTTYTEIDTPADYITVESSTKCTIYAIDLNHSCYLYTDKGIGALSSGTFTVKVKARYHLSNSRAIFFGLSNELGDFGNQEHSQAGPFLALRVRKNNNPVAWQVTLIERDSLGNEYKDTYEHINADQPTSFYLTINWLGANLSADIYSDAARTNLLDTISLTLQSGDYSFRYLYALGSDDRGLSSTRAIALDVEDLEIIDDLANATKELASSFNIRTTDFRNLFSLFTINALPNATENLFSTFIIRGGAGGLLSSFILQNYDVKNLQTCFYLRHPWRMWTDRRYLNKLVDIDNLIIDDGQLQIQITGAMNDLKGWLLSQDIMTYTEWTDISVTPLVIIRATSFATISMLAARGFFKQMGVVSVRPFETQIVDYETVSDYWHSKYEAERAKYLDITNRSTIYVDTEDEDPVFNIDTDLGFHPE